MQTIHDRETTYTGHSSDKMGTIEDKEHVYSVEKSLFRTRVPRPITPTYHLLVVIGTLAIALFIAILYAENLG